MRNLIGSFLVPSGAPAPLAHEALQRQLDGLTAAIGSLLEPSPVGLAVLDRELRLDFVSPALAELTGAPAGPHPRLPLQALVPSAAQLVAAAERVRDGEAPLIEQEITLEGQRRLLASLYPIQIDGGVAAIGCLIESLPRRQAAEDAFTHSPVPIAVCEGPDHVLRLANTAWRGLFAYSGPAGRPLRDCLPALVDHPLFALLDSVYRSNEPVSAGETPLRVLHAGAARECFYTAVARPLHDARGASMGVLVACADVTEQVAARRLVAEVMQSLVWYGLDREQPDYFSHSWYEYTGLRPGSADRGSWQAMVHPDDLANCARASLRAAETAETSEVEARLRRADGLFRWHRLRFACTGGGDLPPRWLCTATDIEEVREARARRQEILAQENAARAQAERASQLKDKFLAVLSHELRAPLATLLLWEKILRAAPDDQATRLRALDAIRDSAHTQTRLVEDLLDVSRAVSGKLHVEMTSLSIESLLRAALAAAAPLASNQGLSLTTELEPLLGEVRADPHRLRQVLDNLLSNAVKFTAAGGRIQLSARHRDDGIEIEVRDTGRGIAPEMLPHIFDPFSQVEDELTRTQGGLGLGLAIAREIVSLHGSELRARSEGLGRGTSFSFTLPKSLAAPASKSNPTIVAMPSPLTGLRVLLVDDDPDVLEALALLLQQAGAAVDCASSTRAAWELLSRTPPDVLLSDVAMPGEDGYSFIRRLRAAEEGSRRLPAVAISAFAMKADTERALQAGFDVHLPKPMDVDHLVSAILKLSKQQPARKSS